MSHVDESRDAWEWVMSHSIYDVWYDSFTYVQWLIRMWHDSCTANPTWGVIFGSSKLKARTFVLPRYSEKRRSSFEPWALKQLSKMSPQVGSAVQTLKNTIIIRCEAINHAATHCNTLQHTATHRPKWDRLYMLDDSLIRDMTHTQDMTWRIHVRHGAFMCVAHEHWY